MMAPGFAQPPYNTVVTSITTYYVTSITTNFYRREPVRRPWLEDSVRISKADRLRLKQGFEDVPAIIDAPKTPRRTAPVARQSVEIVGGGPMRRRWR